jgi:hypothetical protein
MFCAVMASGMNRSEQEQLYRQSRDVIIKASSSRQALDGVTSQTQGTGDDIVLSVLNSPIVSSCPSYTRQQQNNRQQQEAASSSSSDDDDGVFADQDLEERRRLKTNFNEVENNPVVNQSAPEATSRFRFFGEHLRPFRNFRGPRFGEAHHKRVPTPIKRRHRRYNDASARYRTKSDDLEDEDIDDDDDEDAVDRVETVHGSGSGHAGRGPPGVPDPYYPIYLPIDQAFKAKYVFFHKKGKTFQERVYVFLEHPAGWLCFVYHFTV